MLTHLHHCKPRRVYGTAGTAGQLARDARQGHAGIRRSTNSQLVPGKGRTVLQSSSARTTCKQRATCQQHAGSSCPSAHRASCPFAHAPPPPPSHARARVGHAAQRVVCRVEPTRAGVAASAHSSTRLNQQSDVETCQPHASSADEVWARSQTPWACVACMHRDSTAARQRVRQSPHSATSAQRHRLSRREVESPPTREGIEPDDALHPPANNQPVKGAPAASAPPHCCWQRGHPPCVCATVRPPTRGKAVTSHTHGRLRMRAQAHSWRGCAGHHTPTHPLGWQRSSDKQGQTAGGRAWASRGCAAQPDVRR
jgi:hypothetical protein